MAGSVDPSRRCVYAHCYTDDLSGQVFTVRCSGYHYVGPGGATDGTSVCRAHAAYHAQLVDLKQRRDEVKLLRGQLKELSAKYKALRQQSKAKAAA